jgi:hypothetical protein
MIYESNSVEKNFDELAADLEKMKNWTLNKIKKLEDSTNIKRIQQFKPTYLGRTQVNLRESSGYFNKTMYIHLNVPNEFYKNLEDKSLLNGFSTTDRWDSTTLKIAIREENKENLAKFKQMLNVIQETDQITHDENLKIKEDNQAIETAIFYMLDQIGIRRTFYDYKTNRSTKKTEQSYHFTSEIKGQIPTYYPANSLEDRKKDLIRQIDNYWNKEISKLIEERKRKEKEQKEKEQNRKLALLLAKYELDLDSEWNDIMDKILEKNKYLRLAYYLEKNRGDWTSGCDYADTGLSLFGVESELDEAIYNDISDYIDNWDQHMDGRCFRDCEYNYSVLYGMVEDDNLMKDFGVVQEQLQDY